MRQIYIIPALLLFTIICCKHGKEHGTNMGTVKHSSGYASVNGLKMYYEMHGEGGMPLLLIHGGGSTIETSFGNIIPFAGILWKGHCS